MTKADKPKRRPSKKTEALEIRLSPEEKSAFLDACGKMGRSASAVIRDAMRAYANFGPMARLPGSPIMIISAFAGAALGAFALIQITHAADAPPQERLYGMDEFAALDGDFDRRLTLDEFRQAEGSARDILRRSHDGRQFSAGRTGMVMGILIAHDLDPTRFLRQPETVSTSCWSGVNGYFAEFQARRFQHWDQDGDGVVSPQEFSALKLAEIRMQFDARDRNGDGMISEPDDGLPVQQPSREALTTVLGPAQPSAWSPTTCDAEQALPQLSTPPEPDSEAFEDMVIQAQQGEYLVWDFNRDGIITFEEYLAHRS
ncbi:hypothetical protein [uncultured Maricaulis sp.]|uniref:hypothetical protein n=1 Tax=uncultured Maricaulis sp. TaxID=174710 RepID=UPI0030D9DBBE|tara:strand:+ start:2173 stop:3117 length:945 start_codon:yes stop_codon:yes gene_type:complete